MEKTIRIFLASSEELHNDRVAFGDFVRSLNDIYQRRSISIRLLKWEEFDNSITFSTQEGKKHRKQGEYNQKIDNSDIFVALFHTKAGEFTVEEFNYAMNLFEKNKTPKIYVYFKAIDDTTKEDESLSDFKKTLSDEMGHYWGHYNSQDSLHFNFVMQLLLQIEESSKTDNIKVEDGQVKLHDVTIANMQSLGFASGNETYQQMRLKLSDFPKKIEKLRSLTERTTDEELRQELEEQLQEKLNDFNNLKEKCITLEKDLLDTAIRITKMEQENVSAMVFRAIDAFEKGDIFLANELLDEVEHEADRHFQKLESQQELVHKDIDALQLQAKTVMADAATPIDKRKERTLSIYEKADLWAERSMYDKEKYTDLLIDYHHFLREYGYYKKVLGVLERERQIIVSLYGENSKDIAWVYCAFGGIYNDLGGKDGYLRSLYYYDKGLQISEKIEDNENQLCVFYNNKAIVLEELCRYEEALEFYKKSAVIAEKIYGENHLSTATSYGNIASICNTLDLQEEATRYLAKAIKIKKNLFGEDHLEMTFLYMELAQKKGNCGEFDQALDYCNKALKIRQRDLGNLHPLTLSTYSTIADIYAITGHYTEALDYLYQVQDINHKVYGEENDMTAATYIEIGDTLMAMNHYKEAEKNYSKALEIFKKIWDDNHMDMVNIYKSLHMCAMALGNYEAALDYGFKSKDITVKILGEHHSNVAAINSDISEAYALLKKYELALEYAQQSMIILNDKTPDDRTLIIRNLLNTAIVRTKLEQHTESLDALNKAIPLAINIYGEDHVIVATLFVAIGRNYLGTCEYQKSLDYFLKAMAIQKKNLGASCAYLADSYAEIARAYKGLGYEDIWSRYLNAAVDQAIDSFGKEHPLTKELMNEMFQQDCPFIENARSLL